MCCNAFWTISKEYMQRRRSWLGSALGFSALGGQWSYVILFKFSLLPLRWHHYILSQSQALFLLFNQWNWSLWTDSTNHGVIEDLTVLRFWLAVLMDSEQNKRLCYICSTKTMKTTTWKCLSDHPQHPGNHLKTPWQTHRNTLKNNTKRPSNNLAITQNKTETT